MLSQLPHMYVNILKCEKNYSLKYFYFPKHCGRGPHPDDTALETQVLT